MNIYVVQNQQKQYFRNVGRGGYGKPWRDNLEEAKFYTKIGQVKSRVTWWYKNFPQFGMCRIISFKLDNSNATIMDMTVDTKKSILKAEQRLLKYKIEELRRKLETGTRQKTLIEHDAQKLKAQIEALEGK